MTNNYVRVGQHPNTRFFFFDTRSQSSVSRTKTMVEVELAKRGVYPGPIALWRSCHGVEYPLVGMVRRAR